jgi:hypothetical protein
MDVPGQLTGMADVPALGTILREYNGAEVDWFMLC